METLKKTEYIFDGDVIINGQRHPQIEALHTEANSIEQARNNIIWRYRERYNLTKKLWIDVYIEGTLCTIEEYREAKRRQKELEKCKKANEEMKKTFQEIKNEKGAEQISFPIDELIKK